METVLPAVIGLVGTLVGGTISWFVNVNRGRTQTAWEMHREFNGEAMHRARYCADELLQRDSRILLGDLYKMAPGQDIAHIMIVMNFYQRLWLAISHRIINTSLVPRLFGQIFYWWYLVVFEPRRMPETWHAHDDIKELKNWMDKHATLSDRQKWQELARKSRGCLTTSAEDLIENRQHESGEVPA